MTKEEKLARKQARKAGKVGLGTLILWNSSSCSVALSTLMLGYATFYCTDVLQLAPALVGTLFMVSKIFDSVTDVVAGFIVDRTQTRWGKGRPYEIFMLFLWLATWLLFSCPAGFATAAKCIWIFCMYTFMNSICVTFLNANNVVYMVRAFENKEQQSKIVGYGSIFTMAAAMVFNVLFPTAMAKVGTDAAGWSRLVGMIAIPLTVIGMLRVLTIPEKFTPASEKNGEQVRVKDLLPLLKESRPVLIICLVRFVQNIATGLAIGTYYWQYVIGNLGMMGVASVTTILCLPLAFALPGLRKKFGMAGMSAIGVVVGCVGYLAAFFAGSNMIFYIVATLIISAGAVPLNMMFNMFIADVADYNEWKGIKRMEGTMGSLTGLAGKLGNAFGGFLLGILMSASGYVGGAEVQTGSAILMMRVLASFIPMIFMLAVVVILRFYTVDKQMPQIREDLKARSEAAAE
ncbi:MFS transporter [Gemmiger sp.]